MEKLVFVTDKLTGLKELADENVVSILNKLKDERGIEVKVVETPEMNWAEFGAYAKVLDSEGPDALEDFPELLEEAKDAKYIITSYIGISSRLMDIAKDLKFIGVLRTGCESVNLKAATERGIVVACAADRVVDISADFTVGLMLCEFKNLARWSIIDHNGVWPPDGSFPKNYQWNKRLRYKTVGIAGFNKVGQAVAERMAGFGVNLIAYDPENNTKAAEKLNVKLVSLEEVMSTSDFLFVHADVNEKTKGMISKEMIDLMKPGCFFINSCSADLVDEQALLHCLQEHKIAGAALDVYSQMPLPEDSEFKKLDNATLITHIAGDSVDKPEISFDLVLEDLRRFLDGKELNNERKYQ